MAEKRRQRALAHGPNESKPIGADALLYRDEAIIPADDFPTFVRAHEQYVVQ